MLPLLREINDLKRIRSAGRASSIADRLFASAWSRLAAGEDAAHVAMATTAGALAAARLGDLDPPLLRQAGIAAEEVSAIRRRALAEVADGLGGGLRAKLAAALDSPGRDGRAPPFVRRLAEQPRAGATCPDRPRIVLEPPESHSEHCLMVAVYGVVLAPAYGADAPTVFLASLAHHLHNALLPDSGFTGEMLLGPALEPAFAEATRQALAELDGPLRHAVEEARRVLPDADSPEGRAFHAADTLDRVLQIEQYLRAASTSMDFVLGDMALVHEGPVKRFQDAVLAEMGLLPR
ncbi:MAG: HD domain-containing protein [Acetobacteraceae bacterium]|nr:HD domain-containing protein [Acetobacteraceae bacterium]